MRWRRSRDRIANLQHQLEVEHARAERWKETAERRHERASQEVRARQAAEQQIRVLKRHVATEVTVAQAWSDLKDKRFEMESSLVGPGWFFEERRIKAFEGALRGLLS